MSSVNQNLLPFFSVVIPCYNRAELVVIAIKSVLDQDYNDFELLVVDDGSTDDTAEEVKALMNSDIRIKYFYKENEERSIARNFGIRHALGRYVTFLDSDDRVHVNHLKTAFNLLQRNNMPEVGHLGYQLVDTMGNVLMKRDNFDLKFKDTLINENILTCNAIFIRADVAVKVHFIPSRFAILSEDWYLWLRLASRYRFYFDNSITSSIIQHDNRSLANVDPSKLIKSTTVLVDWLKKDKEFMRFYSGKTSRHFADHYTFLSLILALNGSRISTLKYLRLAASYDITVVMRRRFLASVKHLIRSFF